MSRAEIYEITVNREGSDFQYWAENSPALAKLKAYVATITDSQSPDFVPAKDRLAVFDLDGTLLTENHPNTISRQFYYDFLLGKTGYQASPAVKERAFRSSLSQDDSKLFLEVRDDAYEALRGLNRYQVERLVNQTLSQSVPDMTNLRLGEAFYLPMVEVLSYLEANDFTIYIITGGERDLARIIVKDALRLEPNYIIGYDMVKLPNHLGSTSIYHYIYQAKDSIVRTPKRPMADFGAYESSGAFKALIIERDLGKVPLLAFGNSKNDFSMFEYVLGNPKYKTEAFLLLADDDVRENADFKTASSNLQEAENRSYQTISMRDDWATVFGAGVEKAQQKAAE